MATSSGSSSFQQSTSTSIPGAVNTSQSDFALQLAQYLQSIGQDQMAWAMQEYARAGSVTDAQINNYLQTAQQGSDLGGSLMGRYNDLYGPMTDQYAQEAGTYASPGRIQNEMGRAESGAMQAGRQGEINAEQELQSYGIDPSSGRYQDLVRASKTADAASAANAGETARRAVEAEGTRRKEVAMAAGAQLPGAAVNSLNSAYQGIAGAENAALGLANTGVNLTTSASKFFDPAAGLKYPPVGQTSQSRSLGGAGSGGGGGGGSSKGSSDPFNSDRFGRPSTDNGGPVSSSRGTAPVYSNPNGNLIPRRPSVNEPTSGDPQMAGPEDMGGYNPSDPGASLDPWSQGEGGVLGQSGWGQDFPQYDQSVGGGQQWYDPGSQGGASWNPSQPDYGQGYDPNQQAQWPDPGVGGQSGDTVGDYGGGGSSQATGWDNSGWNTQGGDTGSWDQSALQNWNTGGDADWGDYAKGGVIGQQPRRQQPGGFVPPQMSPSRGQQTDDVSAVIPQTGGKAQINVGEFVLPKDVVQWKGQEFFQKMIAQARKARVGGSQQQ